MAEQEIKETVTEEKEACCTKHKSKIMHKLFGLKGLAIIYKALSIFVILYLVYLISMVWYLSFQTADADKAASAMLTLQLVLTYSFYALVLLTISRVLKTLKKIKHAVEHK